MEKCGEKCEVYSRVTGYFRPVANWNRGKQEEFRDRRVYRVGKTVLLLFGLLALAPVAGCGHNTVSYGDGIMLETTVNPETYAFGVSLRYGKILTACVRENSKVKMTGEGKGNGDASGKSTGANAQGSVEVEIGKQITGYYVDAIKAGVKADELDKYTDGEPKPAEADKK